MSSSQHMSKTHGSISKKQNNASENRAWIFHGRQQGGTNKSLWALGKMMTGLMGSWHESRSPASQTLREILCWDASVSSLCININDT